MARLKALVVVGDGLEDYGDLLAVGRAEAKRLLKTYDLTVPAGLSRLVGFSLEVLITGSS